MAHMKAKELVAAACAVALDLPPEKAELMCNIASRLDITLTASIGAMNQNTTQVAALAGLNGVNNHG